MLSAATGESYVIPGLSLLCLLVTGYMAIRGNKNQVIPSVIHAFVFSFIVGYVLMN